MPGRDGTTLGGHARALAGVLLFGALAAPAYADSGWGGLQLVIYLGLLPLFLLLAGFIVNLFVSRAPRRHKLYIALAIAYSLMGEVILFGSRVVSLPAWAAPVFWLAPLLAWWGAATWLRRRANDRGRDTGRRDGQRGP